METAAFDQTTLLIIVGAVALIVGILIGKSLGGGSSAAQQSLEKELESTKEELEKYKLQVTEHFSKTADLVNNMTESYKDVYRHLAESAEQLGANEQFKLRLESDTSGSTALPEDEAEAPEAAVDTPKDYAPKTSPDEKGMLSEEFGLDKNDATAETDTETAQDTLKEKTAKPEAEKS